MRFIGEGGGLRIPGIPIFGGGTVGGGEYERNVYDTQGNPVAVPDRPGVGIVTELLEAFGQQFHGAPPAQPAPTSDVPSSVPPLSQSGATPTAPAPALPPGPLPGPGFPEGSLGEALEPIDLYPGEHPLDPFPVEPPDEMDYPDGIDNPLIPTPPGVSGPPRAPEWGAGPPVIFSPGPPSLQLVEGGFPGTAVLGPLMREVLRQVVRRIVRTRPRPIRRRRRVEEPPSWPRRPRRFGEPTPAPRRAQPPRIPRQTPGEPEWTSPYPQIEVPRVPLPAPDIAIPAPMPQFPQPRLPAPPVPPTPGGSPWPVSPVPTLPTPQSAPAPAPGAPGAASSTPNSTRSPGGASPGRWPLQNPGVLLASAALSLLLRDRNRAPSRFPLQWGSPSPAPTPAPSPSPFPSVAPSPFPLPGGGTAIAPSPSPLTGLNASALPFAQTEAARDRCHCPKPKRGKRRKCRTRLGVVWKSGPRKGQDAGTRCMSFAK